MLGRSAFGRAPLGRAASLRRGWMPVSRLLARRQAGRSRYPLVHALQEYGRLVKTNCVLARLADRGLGARIGRQLKTGERLCALRRAVSYADQGHIRLRTPTPDQQGEQALCRSIVVNAIIARNTVCTQRVLDEVRATGELITSRQIERISPLAYQQIHRSFDLTSCPSASVRSETRRSRCPRHRPVTRV